MASSSTPIRYRAPELLAPAGTLDAFLAALDAGADAVYTGAGAFNARAAADDLTCEELAWACEVAHGMGARVYVTMNIFVRDDELGECVALARRVLDAGADALIVADLGLCRRLRREVPDVEIHLSTQAGVHAAAGAVLAAEQLGASRVTCGRELTVSEIGAMAATGVEIEAFCHGAICICYAGACSFSARRRGRSANRGDCTQPCRVPYQLVDGVGRRVDARDGDLLLCPCDYLSAGHLDELVRSGVGALKIEGRMKNPDYVYNVVSCYREALDAAVARVNAGESGAGSVAAGATAKAVRRLARSFNRGFTDGYLTGRTGANLMSWERSCNQGVRVGRVIDRRHEEVLVAFEDAVDAGDTLEVRFIPGPNTAKDAPKRWPMVPAPVDAAAGDSVWVRCKRKVEVGAQVNLVRSERLIDAARERVAALRAAGPDPASGRDDAAGHRAAERSLSKNQGASIRGEAGDAACDAAACDAESVRAVCIVDDPQAASDLLDGCYPDALLSWRPQGLDVVPAVFEHRLLEADADAWTRLVPALGVVLDEVSREGDARRQRDLCRRAAFVVCRNLTQVAYAREVGCAFEVASPVTAANGETVRELSRLGARCVWLPEEMGEERIEEISRTLSGGVRLAVWAHGEARLMVCEHCVLTAEGPCTETCLVCPRRLAPRLLVERDGSRLPVAVDALGRTRIFDETPLDLAHAVPRVISAGVTELVYDLTKLRSRVELCAKEG
ncbi:peptidase U32 family protein [Collinsella tanakaei]|uniref:Peptidase U32 collagenase domain-containing protein n=1 Tax=Collinsella tanakaei YIT 12063 TaxID=742742 RepID=G1WJE3_9ACTN|nr:peptidase U32 family protein [Collinsella tanakaei]EGX70467.1 hypothetical protein HMPREF9452_01456 [Collinsella tanakaei YIT 12063]